MLRTVLLMILLALLAAGCGQVRSQAPVGPYPAKIDPKVYEGMWLSTYSGISVSVVVTDEKQGRLKAAWLETEDDISRVQQAEIEMRSSTPGGPAEFLSIRFDPELDGYKGKAPWLLAGIVTNEQNHFAKILVADAGEFATPVESGKLPGMVERHGESTDVYLDELDEAKLGVAFGSDADFDGLFFSGVNYDFKRVSDNPSGSLLVPDAATKWLLKK